MADGQITLRTARITWVLAIVAALLVATGLSGQLMKYLTAHDHVFGLIDLFNLDGERNVPSLFSVFLLLSAASLLALIGLLEHGRGHRDVSRWMLLALCFVYVAIDEAWSLHEMLDLPLRARFPGAHFGVVYYIWVVPAAVLVAALGLYLLGFLRRLPATTRNGFVLAAVLYLSGALGLELLEGRLHELYGTRHLSYSVLVAVEEGLEMSGVIVFIHALLGFLADQYHHLRLHIARGAPEHSADAITQRGLGRPRPAFRSAHR